MTRQEYTLFMEMLTDEGMALLESPQENWARGELARELEAGLERWLLARKRERRRKNGR
jgi:hypothetical protein